MFRKSEIAGLARMAADKVASGNSPNVLAVVNASGALSVVTLGGTVQIRAVRHYKDAASTDIDHDIFDLVVQHGDRTDVLATGSLFEMEAMREVLGERMLRTLRPRQCPMRQWKMLAACAVVAFGAGLFVATPMIPALPKPMGLPGSPTASGAPMPGTPGAVSDQQVDAVELARRLREALANAKPGTRGAMSHPDNPVSLDVPIPTPAAPPIQVAPSTAPVAAPPPAAPRAEVQPAASAPAVAQVAPASAPVTPPHPATPAPTASTAASASAKSAAQPAPAAASSAQAAAEKASAEKLLATLRDLRARLASGEQMTPEMLASLPPDVAQKLQGSMSQDSGNGAVSLIRDPALDPNTLAKAKTDQYGIADIPEANSWAGHGGNIPVPLPGGGDIRTEADMARFGFKPN